MIRAAGRDAGAARHALGRRRSPEPSALRLTRLSRISRGRGFGVRARKPFVIRRSDGLRSSWFCGPVRVVMPAVRLAGSEWNWDHNRRAISVPIGRADDVSTTLKAAGHAVVTLGIGATV